MADWSVGSRPAPEGADRARSQRPEAWLALMPSTCLQRSERTAAEDLKRRSMTCGARPVGRQPYVREAVESHR